RLLPDRQRFTFQTGRSGRVLEDSRRPFTEIERAEPPSSASADDGDEDLVERGRRRTSPQGYAEIDPGGSSVSVRNAAMERGRIASSVTFAAYRIRRTSELLRMARSSSARCHRNSPVGSVSHG